MLWNYLADLATTRIYTPIHIHASIICDSVMVTSHQLTNCEII